MKQITLTGLCLLLIYSLSFAQPDRDYLTGTVMAEEGDTTVPLPSAAVSWLGLDAGVYTQDDGSFRIRKSDQTTMLVVSYVGYKADTIDTDGHAEVNIVFVENMSLDAVNIARRQQSTRVSFIDPLKTELIDETELLKAACCNLSESFETSPSVDVSFTDAITGTRQIQMLGLAGPYTQITRENMPSVRGLNAMYGLTFTLGTWVEGMQLNKGTGTVVNGFESIAGQINVELRKPESAEKLYLNLYGNQMGRVEANANWAQELPGTNWSTALLLHTKSNRTRNDVNDDGFMDNPLSNHFIGLNRWKYIGTNGLLFQAGIKTTNVRNIAGELDFDPTSDLLGTDVWGMQLNVDRLEGWAKLGKVFLDIPWRTFGFQVSGSNHRQNSVFGLNDYDARHQSLYTNFIYQDIFANTNHTFKTGASLMVDNYQETLNDQPYDRMEVVPGAFFEYTYTYLDKFSLVAGLRGDYHNLFGPFATPRLHMRYAPTQRWVFRASVGRGQRTANILAENNGYFASSRRIVIRGDSSNKPYGLNPEVAWNFGGNLSHYFMIGEREGTISLDFYRTEFQNQIVIDLDENPQQVAFYNLNGQSYSNSFQVQLDYQLIERLDVRLAYRWFDVQTTYGDQLLEKPFVSAHRSFINLAYTTTNNWTFDATLNWQGSKRIPFTGNNPEQYQLPERSPDFYMLHAQVSKKIGKRSEIYLGGENLLDTRQNNPILAPENPFGENFDASLVWGPIFGRNVYAGFRYRIP